MATEETSDLRYHNITVTGKVGVGKTTLTTNLKRVLVPLGWRFSSSSQFMRDWMKENNLSLEQTNGRPDELEKKIDYAVKERLEKESYWVIEGWLTGFMAQGIERVLKVLVICSNDAIRVDRVANRDNLTIEEAKRLIQERERQNTEKWRRLYGNYDFWDSKLYDLVVDTYSASTEESLRMVLKELGYIKRMSGG